MASMVDGQAPTGEQPAPVKCQNLIENEGWYQLYSNLFRGGAAIFTPPGGAIHPVSKEAIGTYLVQHDRESVGDFRARLRDSFTLPYPREIVNIYTSTLFRQDVVRDGIEDVFPSGHLKDIDLRGHSAREFLRQCFTLSQVYGWVGVLTDYPRASGAYLSAYHEALEGRRPYSRIILPTRLWNWERDPATGDFLYAEVWNGQVGEYDPETRAGGLWRRWTANSWVDVDRNGKIVDGGEHSFDRVPLDILVCQSVEGDTGLEPFGQSALVDVANLALHVYQMCSLLESHQRKALFAFLRIGMDPTTAAKSKAAAPNLDLGPSHYFWSEGEVEWIDPPESLPKEAREHILWCVQEMRRATGVATRSEESVEAHSGVALAWEYSSRHNAVYERAQNLEDFESRLWQTHGAWLDIDVPIDSIRYPKEYAIQPIEKELDEIDRLTAIAGEWGAKEALLPLIQQKLRRIAIRDIGHTPAIDDALKAIDSMEVEEPEPVPPQLQQPPMVEEVVVDDENEEDVEEEST